MNIERIGNAGIKCDNIECGYLDKESPDENLADWLNVPCPMCGENLLTQEDLDTCLNFDKAIEMINNMSEEELIEFNKTQSQMLISMGIDISEFERQAANIENEFTIDIHNGIKFIAK
jgi:hypothetical protein